MDHFGIGAGIKGALDIFFHASRGTGRTTSLVESVKDGDRVVFVSHKQEAQFVSLCKERGLKVDTMVCPVDSIEMLLQRPSAPGAGRLIFDHTWVEEFYREAMSMAIFEIGDLQRQMSGFGPAHHETAHAARQTHRWQD